MNRFNTVIVVCVFLAAAAGLYFLSNSATTPGIDGSDNTPTNSSGKVMRISDTAKLYSVEIPKGWSIMHEDSAGVRVSEIAAESPDWDYSEESAEGPFGAVHYKSGAFVQLHTSSEVLPPPYHGASDSQASGVMSKKEIMIDGEKAIYHVFKEPGTQEGLLLDVHIARNGNGYTFTFIYNPTTYPEGEEVFMRMLQSIKFIL